MALKGLDIFKLTPKTNCKECGNPTCMAFAMKVAQGAMAVEKCPHMSAEALAKLSQATAPPMHTVELSGHKLGGETVLLRHENTLVNRNLYGIKLCSCLSQEEAAAKLAAMAAVDYQRIGQRMYVESVFLHCRPEDAPEHCVALAVQAAAAVEVLLVDAQPELAETILAALPEKKPVLVGVNAANWQQYQTLAAASGATLAVGGENLAELHDTVEKLEAAGNHQLLLDLGRLSIKDVWARAFQVRRAALKAGDRSFGYPALVDTAALAPGDPLLQTMLASLFTLRYGSVIILEEMTIAQALPLYGLRQNIFTDPQKPMKVEPGVYPINGADADAVCCLTVDFALTYFVVSGEMERSGVPANLWITDAGGYSVLTAWAAGKLSASSIAAFVEQFGLEEKQRNHTLILPGKVAVLKGEIEAKLPGWKIIVGPNEAMQLVRFLKEYQQA